MLIITFIVSLAFVLVVQSVYHEGINLGRCSNFAIQAKTAVNFNGVQSVVMGSLGVAPGTSITGNYVLNEGAVEDNSTGAINCDADQLVAFDQAVSAVCFANHTLPSPDMSDQLYYPGVYCSTALVISATTVTLDGEGDSDSVWIFQSTTTLTTATTTSFILQNGAQAKNVYWAIGTGVTLGYSSSFVGTILAGTAITLGTGCVVNGRAFAQTAVVFESRGTITIPQSSNSTSNKILTNIESLIEVVNDNPPDYTQNINLGRCESYAIHAGTAVSFDGVQSIVFGSVGVAPGVAITGNYVIHNGAIESNTLGAINCAADKLLAYNQAVNAVCYANHTLQAADMAGLSFYPGVYCSASGTLDISAATVTLDGLMNPNSVWIFQAASTLTTATATSFILKNGAQAKNVYWVVGSSASLGYSSSFVGTILADVSITLGSGVNLNGRVFAESAITASSQATVIADVPVITSSFRSISKFYVETVNKLNDNSAYRNQPTVVIVLFAIGFVLMNNYFSNMNKQIIVENNIVKDYSSFQQSFQNEI